MALLRTAPLLLTLPLAAQTPLTFELVAEGLLDPLAPAAPPGDDRVFIGEHGGVIQVVQPDQTTPTVFLDLSAKVPPPPAGEAGFLGMTFHPKYADNGYFYVHYTDTNFDTVIERYQVSASDPNVADPASASLVLFIPQPSNFHNGGGIRFGPDGYLYIGLGDGGASLGPQCTAQDTAALLGKILRIDVDSAAPYAIPPTNPFVGVAGAAPEVLHLGLRNPWRFALDSLTGDLFIGDVGAANWEEISYAPGGSGGLNFGWPLDEGDVCHVFHSCAAVFPSCDDPSFTKPILTLDHLTAPFYCAVVGGEVYRGCALPELQGRMFYTDYCASQLISVVFDPVQGISDVRDHTPEVGAFFPTSMFITSMGVDGHGELLFVYQATPDLDGKLYRIVPAQPPAGSVDCDGNGRDDACEIAGEGTLDLNQDGILDVCQTLHAEGFQVSVSGGGLQTMFLHAGVGNRFRSYLMAGSTTGTSGIPYGSVTLPLTFDFYTNFTLLNPGTPPLVNTLGTLDGAGQATAAFQAAPGLLPTSSIGLSVFHAYVVLTGQFKPLLASNYVRLRLTP